MAVYLYSFHIHIIANTPENEMSSTIGSEVQYKRCEKDIHMQVVVNYYMKARRNIALIPYQTLKS